MGAAALSWPDFVWLIGSLQVVGFRAGQGDLAKASFPRAAFLKGENSRPTIVVRSDASGFFVFRGGRPVIADLATPGVRAPRASAIIGAPRCGGEGGR